ncbi:MAG TPA: hypothetical protein VGJ00_07745 [Rhabdochlamydiaceae bacterium]|jgi:hypothetical protein
MLNPVSQHSLPSMAIPMDVLAPFKACQKCFSLYADVKSPSPLGETGIKISQFFWELWIKVYYTMRTLVKLPFIPPQAMQNYINRIGDFREQIVHCGNDWAGKERVLAHFEGIPLQIQDEFAHISFEKLNEFYVTSDQAQFSLLKKQFTLECDFMISVLQRLLPLSQAIARCRGRPEEGGDPFAYRRAQLPLANELAILSLDQIGPIQRERAKQIAAMGKILPEDHYTDRRDRVTLYDKYQDPVLFDGPIALPIGHLNVPMPPPGSNSGVSAQPRLDHAIEASSIRRILNDPDASSHNCPLCRFDYMADPSKIKMDVAQQIKIAEEFISALNSVSDQQISARLQQLIINLSQEFAGSGNVQAAHIQKAKDKVVALIRDLPDTLYSRVERLYKQLPSS